jgi:hypothetical protein
MKKAAFVSLAMVIAGCLLASAWGQGQQKAKDNEGKAAAGAPSPFVGRVVVISSKGDGTGVALLDPKIKKLGQADFLVGVAGEIPNDPGAWAQGQMVWLPIDDCAQLVEFKNIDEVKKSGVLQGPDPIPAHN